MYLFVYLLLLIKNNMNEYKRLLYINIIFHEMNLLT